MGENEKPQFAIVVGDLLRGIAAVYGPFSDRSTVRQWAHGDHGEDRFENWLSLPLITPTDDAGEEDDC